MFCLCVSILDYGKRPVISQELEPYLTDPKFLCSEIFDYQRFLSESHSGFPQKALWDEVSTKKDEKSENQKKDENGLNNDKISASQNIAKRENTKAVSDQQDKVSTQNKPELRNSQTQTPSQRTPRSAACYSTGTIASRAKLMLDLTQTGVKCTDNGQKTGDLKPQSHDESNGSSQQPVVNVNNISLNNSSQLVPSKFKYSQGTFVNGSATNSLTNITVLSDDECLECRKKTPISQDEINLCPPPIPSIRKSSAVSLDGIKLKTLYGENNANKTSTKLHKDDGDENNNHQNGCVDSGSVTVATFRSRNGSANPKVD